MDRERRRRALEAIALADDATAGDRLRALMELAAFDDEARPALLNEAEGLSDDEVAAELAELAAPCGGGVGVLREALSGRPTSALTSILADVLGPGVRFPDLAAAIRAEVERRAEEIAAERRDVRRAPARIEARAKRLVDGLKGRGEPRGRRDGPRGRGASGGGARSCSRPEGGRRAAGAPAGDRRGRRLVSRARVLVPRPQRGLAASAEPPRGGGISRAQVASSVRASATSRSTPPRPKPRRRDRSVPIVPRRCPEPSEAEATHQDKRRIV